MDNNIKTVNFTLLAYTVCFTANWLFVTSIDKIFLSGLFFPQIHIIILGKVLGWGFVFCLINFDFTDSIS